MLLLRTSRGVDPGIPLLRSLGSNAHVWLPGANGVSVASLPSNNFLLSDGSTGYSTVDSVDGLTLDGMGSLGSELVAGNNLSTATVTGSCVKNSNTQFTLSANAIANRIIIALPLIVAPAAVFHTVRLKADKACTILASNLWNNSKSLALTMSYQTFEFVLADDTAPHSQNLSFYTTTDSPVVVDVEYVSSKQYSGTHLTQATTANKPLVRRGMYNQITQNTNLTNAAWLDYRSCTVSGQAIVEAAATASHFIQRVTAVTIVSGVVYTTAYLVKANGRNFFAAIGDAAGGFLASPCRWNVSTGANTVTGAGCTVSSADAGSGWYLFTITATATGATARPAFGPCLDGTTTPGGFQSYLGDGVSGVLVAAVGVMAGSWTAAQILAEGGIPTTTATAASNPTSGKYWWSFDGSNDSLLSGNLGITNACTIVVAGRVNSLAAAQTFFGEDANGVVFYVATDGHIAITKAGVSVMVSTAAGVIVAGAPFVITARLSGGVAVIRKNGLLSATAVSGLTFSATTGARVGGNFGSNQFLNGALGWVVSLPVALSDAECLLVERLVSSQFPNGPVF